MELKDSTSISLDQLNDDCLACIFQRVYELHNQVQIARVCQRFNMIIVRMWLRQKRYQSLNLEEWRSWLPDERDLSYFMRVMCDGLSSVVVEDDTLTQSLIYIQQNLKEKNVEELSDNSVTLCLNNVRDFVDEEKSMDTTATDVDMHMVLQLMPNLRTLNVKEPLSGRYVSHFRYLEELHLYTPSEKQFELNDVYFAEICQNLKYLRVLDIRFDYGISRLQLKPVLNCENLAVLKVNLNPLKACLTEVLRLPKLVQLNVMLDFEIDVSAIQNVDTYDYKIYETLEFYDIIRTQNARIIGLAIDLHYFPLKSNWALDLGLWEGGRKLRKFALCSCEFTADPLEEYAYRMESLELLCCRYWEQLRNKHVLSFVERCPRLQHVDVSYCANIDGKLLYQILNVLEKRASKRPLYIYYMSSGLEDEVEKENAQFWRQQHFIKLFTDFSPGSEKGLSCVYRGYEFDFISNDEIGETAPR